jgi:hypothetical protein
LPYCTGSVLTISGSGFVTDGGVKSVTIGGVPAASFFVGSDSVMYAVVGSGAQNGPVVVTTPLGSVTSTQTESVFPCASGPPTAKPSVTSSTPKSVKAGKRVELIGSGFVGTTSVTVNGAAAKYAIPSDENIYVTIPSGTKAGSKASVTITSSAGTTTASVKVAG